MPTRRALVLSLAAAAAGLAISLPAHALGSLVDMEVVDRSQGGETLAPYYYRGQSFIAGRPGNRYAVRLTNRSGVRVLVVLSVDGVNAVTGETAGFNQNGYVLAPYASAEITGWRKNLQEAAAFYFTALPDSYAARTNRPDNVGVIGAAVFRERQRQPEPPMGWSGELSARDRAAGAMGGLGSGSGAPAPAAAAPAEHSAQAAKSDSGSALARQERLGTGHGEREYAPVTRTEFERASDTPSEVVKLRYDSYPNLLASGVIPRPRPPLPRGTPEPFPGGFVPDPS
jgi:hypothetical protein